MSKIIQLKDRETHEVAYPATHVEAVYDEKGNKLDSILTTKANIEDLSNVLAEQVLEPTRDDLNHLTREEAKKDLFIDLWNSVNAGVGQYNKDTGFFELNGLTDITYEQAINIYEKGRLTFPYPTPIDNELVRTNILDNSLLSIFDLAPRLQLLVRSNTIEVLRINYNDTYGTRLSDDQNHGGLFYSLLVRAPKLRHILGVVDMSLISNPNSYLFNESSFFPLLETLKIRNLHISLKLMQCPALSLESLQFLVAGASNTSPITVTVHSEIYQKLIDTSNTEWNKVLLDASAKDISFADGGGLTFFDGTTLYNMRYSLHPMQGDTLATNIKIDTGGKIPDGTMIYSNADELTGITKGKKFNIGVQEDNLPLSCQIMECNDITTGQYNTYNVENGLTTGNASCTISCQIELKRTKKEIVKFDDDTVYDLSFAEGWYTGEFYIHMMKLNTNGKLPNGMILYPGNTSGIDFLKGNGWYTVSSKVNENPTLTITSISSTYNGAPTTSGDDRIEITDNIDGPYSMKCTLSGYIVVETETD